MVFIKDVVKFIKCTRYIDKNEEAKTNNYQKKKTMKTIFQFILRFVKNIILVS